MKKLTILMLTLILSACATMPAKQGAMNQQMSWQARQNQLNTIRQWHLTGAVAIKTAQRGQTASLVWQQQKQAYNIDLFGPLGAGRVSLIGDPNSVKLLTNGKQYRAKTPEALMQKLLGWHLPIANLYYWIRGLAAPKIPARLTFDKYHHLRDLQQQNWHVHFLLYTNSHEIDLPSKILLQHNDLQVKIIISRWEM